LEDFQFLLCNPPLTLNLGGVTENFEFEMDDDTEVYRSCSATLNGELYVFGGFTQSKQVLSPF